MAVRDDFIEALNTCIDRLNQGESVEAILLDYPSLANQLRPMLEAGLLFPRARFPVGDVESAEEAEESTIREAIRREFRRGIRWINWLLLLIIIGGGIILVAIIAGGSGVPPVLLVTSSPTWTATYTVTSTMTASATLTLTTRPTSTPTATVIAIDTTTNTPTPPPSPTSTVVTEIGRIIIEGPVSRIQDNIITIYDLPIVLPINDPVLSVIRVGDVVRVEGTQEVEFVQAVTLIFINVTVVIVDGQVWRGDSCASPPPAWAQAGAADWYSRCAPAPSNPSGGNSGSSGDDDDD
jgi:hypothetical protein